MVIFMDTYVRYFIGPFIKTFLAWSTDVKVRWNAASGGVGTALLMYMLREGLVDAVLVPKPRVRQGLVYGVYTIIKEPSELPKYSGSLYAPTFGLIKILNYALNKFRHVAVTAIPCQAGVIRSLIKRQKLEEKVLVIGFYCSNTPGINATRYVIKRFDINPDDLESIKYRGCGWPGYTCLKTRIQDIKIPFVSFWHSGFGQYFYFYGLGCYLCTDHTSMFADLSLADPWTLPHEPIKKLGGATLVVARSKKGLKIFEDAIKAGYIKAIEVDPIYSINDSLLFRLAVRALYRHKHAKLPPSLPPSFATIASELTYYFGRFLASNERLWIILRPYNKFIPIIIYTIASFLDSKFRTTWMRIYTDRKFLQEKRSKYLTLMLNENEKLD
jgi:coenzyme F420-reducing hydrogenase beta subunit